MCKHISRDLARCLWAGLGVGGECRKTEKECAVWVPPQCPRAVGCRLGPRRRLPLGWLFGDHHVFLPPQPQHSHLVIQQLLSHLDANSRSAATVRAGIVEVLSEAAVIAATGSVGKGVRSRRRGAGGRSRRWV